jgi:hypothetical protein
VRACVRVAGESAGEYPTSLVGIWMCYGPPATRDDRARQRQPRSSCWQPRSAALVARQSTLSGHQTDHPDSARLTDPCKRLRLNTLAITVYNTYHIEWGFTLLECILTCQNRRQGGRGSRLADWRRQRRIPPLRLFFANWPPLHSARAPVAMLRYTLLV